VEGTRLVDELRQRGTGRLYVGGLATDYCVRASVLDARRAGFDVTVLLDAVAGIYRRAGHSARALAELREAGAAAITRAEWAFAPEACLSQPG